MYPGTRLPVRKANPPTRAASRSRSCMRFRQASDRGLAAGLMNGLELLPPTGWTWSAPSQFRSYFWLLGLKTIGLGGELAA